ncbi:MAG TPA: tetratricopeptide repeat protein [Polyangium sp.]|nr:tetratricopeptide repeat protein [Polyangium sp.]
MSHAAELFMCSDPADRALRDELCALLGPLVDAGLVREFPSESPNEHPGARLASADVVVALLSPDALCDGSSVKTMIADALELEKQRRTVFIPIRARICSLDTGPLADRVVYPRDTTALDSKELRDYAFRDALSGILTGITLCHVTVGDLLLESERETAASKSFLHARSIAEKLADEFPDDLDHLALLALVRDRVGEALLAMGDGPGALAAFQLARETHERLADRAVDRPARRRLLARCIESIGDVLRAMGEKPLALKTFQECLSLRNELVREIGDVCSRREVAATHVRLGHVLRAMGDAPRALAAFRQGMVVADLLAQENASSSTALVSQAEAAVFQAERALFCFRTASVLADGEKAEKEEARVLLLQALGVYHELEQQNVLPEAHKIWPPAIEAMLDSLDT